MIFAKKIIVTIAAFLALCTSSFGADTSGKVLGTVIDPSGNPVPHAAVALTNNATGVKQAATTDAQGGFAFPVVPVGTYDLIVNIDNFRPYKRSNIAIDLGSAVQLEVRLELAGINQTMTITEESNQVETSDTKLGQVIESKQVTGLPLTGVCVPGSRNRPESSA